MNNTNRYKTQAINPSVLSVLDVVSDGKVVSAETWKSLWLLVFDKINAINSFCLTLDELKVNWSESLTAFNTAFSAFIEKYNALSKSFVHYGLDEPTNPHIRFWVKPTGTIPDDRLVHVHELYTALKQSEVKLATSFAADIGNIQAALDNIIAIQNELIGGGSV